VSALPPETGRQRALRLPAEQSPAFEDLQTLIDTAADSGMTTGGDHSIDEIALRIGGAAGFGLELECEELAIVKQYQIADTGLHAQGFEDRGFDRASPATIRYRKPDQATSGAQLEVLAYCALNLLFATARLAAKCTVNCMASQTIGTFFLHSARADLGTH
jgi:hypothetical protein